MASQMEQGVSCAISQARMVQQEGKFETKENLRTKQSLEQVGANSLSWQRKKNTQRRYAGGGGISCKPRRTASVRCFASQLKKKCWRRIEWTKEEGKCKEGRGDDPQWLIIHADYVNRWMFVWMTANWRAVLSQVGQIVESFQTAKGNEVEMRNKSCGRSDVWCVVTKFSAIGHSGNGLSWNVSEQLAERYKQGRIKDVCDLLGDRRVWLARKEGRNADAKVWPSQSMGWAVSWQCWRRSN